MRENLFKAKRSDNGEWAEGYVFKAKHHWHEHGIHEDWIVVNAIQNGGWCNVYEKYPVDKNTISSYTGLKDKYGNKIWENDIVKITYCDVSDEIGWIKYSNFGMRYYFVVGTEIYSIDDSCDIEVIGNTFDNPELLGGQ